LSNKPGRELPHIRFWVESFVGVSIILRNLSKKGLIFSFSKVIQCERVQGIGVSLLVKESFSDLNIPNWDICLDIVKV